MAAVKRPAQLLVLIAALVACLGGLSLGPRSGLAYAQTFVPGARISGEQSGPGNPSFQPVTPCGTPIHSYVDVNNCVTQMCGPQPAEADPAWPAWTQCAQQVRQPILQASAEAVGATCAEPGGGPCISNLPAPYVTADCDPASDPSGCTQLVGYQQGENGQQGPIAGFNGLPAAPGNPGALLGELQQLTQGGGAGGGSLTPAEIQQAQQLAQAIQGAGSGGSGGLSCQAVPSGSLPGLLRTGIPIGVLLQQLCFPQPAGEASSQNQGNTQTNQQGQNQPPAQTQTQPQQQTQSNAPPQTQQQEPRCQYTGLLPDPGPADDTNHVWIQHNANATRNLANRAGDPNGAFAQGQGAIGVFTNPTDPNNPNGDPNGRAFYADGWAWIVNILEQAVAGAGPTNWLITPNNPGTCAIAYDFGQQIGWDFTLVAHGNPPNRPNNGAVAIPANCVIIIILNLPASRVVTAYPYTQDQFPNAPVFPYAGPCQSSPG